MNQHEKEGKRISGKSDSLRSKVLMRSMGVGER